MNTMQRTIPVRFARSRWLDVTVAAALATIILASDAHAQADPQRPPAAAKEKLAEGWADMGANRLYSMKFDGGPTYRLSEIWKKTFPNDNFVITDSARGLALPAFEIRLVRLTELARSIAFLSEGALTVEVVERDSTAPGTTGNIWRIGTASPAEAPAIKMRAVAAPRLFADEGIIRRLLEAVHNVEEERLRYAIESSEITKTKRPNERQTVVTPLSDQKVFVLIGTENGIAGIESFIQASEQSAVESAKTAKSGK